MNANSIPKQVLANLGQILEETGKESVKQVGLATESIITGKQLLGDIAKMSEGDLASKKAEDEVRRKKEEAELLSKINGKGRDVEGEIAEVVKEKEDKEKEAEQRALEEIRARREQERLEMENAEVQVSSNPSKQKKSRGSAFVHGKKKSQQPDPSQMSQTSEFKGKVD